MTEKRYDDDEVDKIVSKRLKEQADNIRQLNLEEELKRITTRLDQANGLKREMVTKEEFRRFVLELKEGQQIFLEGASRLYVLKAELGPLTLKAFIEGVKGLTLEQLSVLPVMIREKSEELEREENKKKWHETFFGRLAILSAVGVLIVQFGELLLLIFKKG